MLEPVAALRAGHRSPRRLTATTRVAILDTMGSGLAEAVRERLARGDKTGAVKAIYAELAPEIARRVAGTIRGAAAEDVCQRVWEAVAAEVESYADEPRGRVFAVARNKINDHFRSLKRHPRASLDDAIGRLIETSRLRPSKQLADAELRRAVRAASEALDPISRTLLEWRYVEGIKPRAMIARIRAEGRAVELDVATQLARADAATGVKKRVEEDKLANLLAARVHRAVERVCGFVDDQGP
jgi:RNA polymerase sigma factor (sigma-70 family)